MQNQIAGKRIWAVVLAFFIVVNLTSLTALAASIPAPTNVSLSDRGNQHASFQWDWPGEARRYELVLYKEGIGEISRKTSRMASSWSSHEPYYVGEWGIIQQYGSGKYYYTLQYLGDTPAENSNVVTSNTYTYKDPEKPAPTPTNLRWEEVGDQLFMRWDYKDYDPDIYSSYLTEGSYIIRIYRNGTLVYGEPEDTTSINSGSDRNRQPWSDYQEWLDDGFLNGDYTFTVQIRTRKIKDMTNSAISAHSPARNMGTGASPPPATPVISISNHPAAKTTVTENSISKALAVAATVSNGSMPSYQWYSTTTASNNGGSPLSGETGGVFTIPSNLTTGVYYYFCEISAINATPVRSHVAKVVVDPQAPAVKPSKEPTILSDNPIVLDMDGVKTAYINISLGSSGIAAATKVDVTVDGDSVTVSPNKLTSDGNIKVAAIREGTSEISISFSGVEESYNKTITANVTNDLVTQTHTITASAGSGGSITPSGTVAVNEGSDQAFAITPNSNYQISDVLVDGVSVGAVSGYTFSNVNNKHTISATFTYIGGSGGSSSSGRSSSSSGGSSRADGNTTTIPSFNSSSNVSSDGSVNATTIKAELDSAITAATGNTTTVRTRNAQSISASTLRTLANTAAAVNKTAILHADTLGTNGKIQARLYVEPAKLTGLTGELRLAVYVQDDKVSSVKNLFGKHFSNNIAVVSFEQQGSLGARLQVAAKVDLNGLDISNLVFYSYDKTSNRYVRVNNAAYFIDSNGYLHFYTEQGGAIVISSGTLQAK